MALLRKFFYRKPPDGLFEICERVYVFESCFTTDVWEEEDYRVYLRSIRGQLQDHYPDASVLVFNFGDGNSNSKVANVFAKYDMTIMRYPRHYEGCPLLSVELIHHFLRSSESWLSVSHQNVILMHCECGGWPVLAFMLAALLLYRKYYTGELKTLDMLYKQSPREILRLFSPLNPIPSQLRYLQYVSRRNVASQWPPLDRALTLDCVMMRMIPNFDGNGGCRPIFRIYGQDPLHVSDRNPKVLFLTPKRSKIVRHYKQGECQIVKIDINCQIQGDVVLECISLYDDMEREEMMFRVMFNTAFIRSNILMLNRDEIDILWDAKDHFPKEFRAEVLFSEMDAASSMVPVDLSCFEEKEGLPEEAFAKVQEIFSSVDWLVTKADAARDVIQQITASPPRKETAALLNDLLPEKQLAKVNLTGPTLDKLKDFAYSPSPPQPPSDPPSAPPPPPPSLPPNNLSASIPTKSSQVPTSAIQTPTSGTVPKSLLSHLLPPHLQTQLLEKHCTKPTPPPPSTPPSSPHLPFHFKDSTDWIGSSPSPAPPPQTRLPPSPSPPPTSPPPTTPPLTDSTTTKTKPPPPPPPSLSPPLPPPPPPPTPPPPPSPHLREKSAISTGTPPPPPPPPIATKEESSVLGAGPPPLPPHVPSTGGVPPPPPVPSTGGGPPPPPVPSTGGVPPPPPVPSMGGVPPPPPVPSTGGGPPPPPVPSTGGVPPPPPVPSTGGGPPPPPVPSTGGGPPPPPVPSTGGGPPPPPVPSTGGAPPPPPPSGNSSLSPPPPAIPPPGTKGRGLSRTITSRNNQTKKLKPLHWLKITRAVQGSLWAEAQKSGAKPPEIDISELESLFAAAAPNSGRRGPSGKSDSRASLGSKSEKVQLIDHRRAYNCEIMLSKVKVPLPELMASVLTLEDSALDEDQVDNLIKFCPTNEEMELLKAYKGEKDKLGKCEQFFLELMQVPRTESKLRVFSFKIQFSTQVSDLRNSLNVVNSTAEQIRGSTKLKKVMQTILSLGNALNQGTARGSAVGFRLDSLLKLTETRARNNKMTLMHYLCKVLADKLPDVLDFSKDLASLEPASKIQLKFLAEEMQSISKGLEKVVHELSMSENDGPVSENFRKVLKEFLSYAEGEVRFLASLYSGVGRNVDSLIIYFGEDPARCPFEQVVSTLLNFLRMFNKAHDENCKQLELEKKKAAKEEAENEKLNTVASQTKAEQQQPISSPVKYVK